MKASEIFTKFAEFNVEDDFYDNDKKEELINTFKNLTSIDDPKIRKFVEQWLKSANDLVEEMDLMEYEIEDSKDDVKKDNKEKDIDDNTDEKEYKPDEEKSDETEKETEKKEETVKEESKKEVKPQLTENDIYRKIASRFLM